MKVINDGNEYENGWYNRNVKTERNINDIKEKVLIVRNIGENNNYNEDCHRCYSYNNQNNKRYLSCCNKEKKRNDKLCKNMLIKNQILNEKRKVIKKMSDVQYKESNFTEYYDINNNNNNYGEISYSLHNENNNYKCKYLNNINNNKHTENNYTHSYYTNTENYLYENKMPNNTVLNYDNYNSTHRHYHPIKDISTNMESILNKTMDILNKYPRKCKSQKNKTIPLLINQNISHHFNYKTTQNKIHSIKHQYKHNITDRQQTENEQHYETNFTFNEPVNHQSSLPKATKKTNQFTSVQTTNNEKEKNVDSPNNINQNLNIDNTTKLKDKKHNYYTLNAYKIREQHFLKTRNNKNKNKQIINHSNTYENNIHKKEYCYQCKQLQHQNKKLNQMYFTTKG